MGVSKSMKVDFYLGINLQGTFCLWFTIVLGVFLKVMTNFYSDKISAEGHLHLL